ncbi:MAG: CARDB domain-containing protein [Candidatus Aenigmatarchaeota archaeon]
MKINGYICIGMLIFIAMFTVAKAEYFEASSLNIILTKQLPYPVQPGQNLSIEIEVQNNGFEAAENYSIEIIENLPFKVLPGEEKVKTFSKISPRSSVKASWKLIVDSKAVSGDYEIGFKVYRNDPKIWVLYKVFVAVQGKPELVIQDVDMEGVAEPGGQITMKINLSNVGTGDARQIRTNFISVPEITPIFSVSKYLDELKPGQSKIAEINLSVSPEAEYKTYLSNLTVFYVDESGQGWTNSFSIGIPIKGSVSLMIIDIKPNLERQKLDIEVANKGTAEAKAITAELIIDGKVIGIDYTSSLKPNKKVTFSYPLILQGSGHLNLTYIGPELEDVHESKDIVLNFEKKENQGLFVIIGMFLLAGLGYWFFRKRKYKLKK